MISRVLVVCAGNVCRSPMVAALLTRSLQSVAVESAGITALVGHAADPIAVDLMRERGLDIQSHRARQLLSWMPATSDLVFVMDGLQRRHLEQRFATLHGRIYRLGDLPTTSHSGTGFDIPDPYLKDRESFKESLRLIEASVEGWSKRINDICGTAAGPNLTVGTSSS
ncbi:low molecular weight protein-tyrosine-phosphatase [Paraburkholderia sediminicola]|uniref:low molecular weight protein-tyrosine-phosphatase n=1 Tax=Paraburkholderia sediminicola TaxID=458836 RepID=UPI0038B760BB